MTPLPCPFCGRAPVLSRGKAMDTTTGELHWISCFCGNGTVCAYKSGETAAVAIARWNTRT